MSLSCFSIDSSFDSTSAFSFSSLDIVFSNEFESSLIEFSVSSILDSTCSSIFLNLNKISALIPASSSFSVFPSRISILSLRFWISSE